MITSLAVIVLASLQIPLWTVSVFRPNNNVHIALGSYKLCPSDVAAARKIIEMVSPGVMLAPQSIGGTVSLLSGDYPQIAVREDAERLWLGSDAERRISAVGFVSGDLTRRDDFAWVIHRFPAIVSVVLSKDSIGSSKETNQLLMSLGYINSTPLNETYIVAWKPK